MEHLKNLGVDTSKASMKFIDVYPSCDYSEDEICEFIPVDCRFNASIYNEGGKTFTLQDILELLPKFILKDGLNYDLTSDMHNRIAYEIDWDIISVGDINDYSRLHTEIDEYNFLDVCYRMLCWVAENGYLNKEE